MGDRKRSTLDLTKKQEPNCPEKIKTVRFVTGSFALLRTAIDWRPAPDDTLATAPAACNLVEPAYAASGETIGKAAVIAPKASASFILPPKIDCRRDLRAALPQRTMKRKTKCGVSPPWFSVAIASDKVDGCQRAPNVPEMWALSHFWRCSGHHASRRRSKPARPYIDRLMSLILLIFPSTGPVLRGRSIAARTASKSRMRPRAKDAMGLSRADANHPSSVSALRSTSKSWNSRRRSAACAIAGEAVRKALMCVF